MGNAKGLLPEKEKSQSFNFLSEQKESNILAKSWNEGTQGGHCEDQELGRRGTGDREEKGKKNKRRAL